MSSINITVKDKTPELMQKLDAAIGRFVRKAAGFVQGQLILEKNKRKSGKIYRRGKSGTHQASAPGESPATDSANLYPSIAIIAENSLETRIGTPVEYAPYLEEGTARMAARPLWAPVAKGSLPTLEAMLRTEIQGVH